MNRTLIVLGHLPLGRLPCDRVIVREHFYLLFPCPARCCLSLLVTVIFWLLRQ